MTDAPITTSESPKPKNIKKLIVLFAVIIIVAAAASFFMFVPKFDKETVKSRLDLLAASIAQSGGSSLATFTYEDIVISGGFFSKNAKIVNPKFEMAELSPNKKRVIKTAAIYLTPQSSDLSSYTLAFKDPVMVTGDGYNTEVSFDGEAVYAAQIEKVADGAVVEHTLTLPKSIQLKDMRESPIAQPYSLSYDQGATIYLKTDAAGVMLESRLAISNMQLKQEGEAGGVVLGSLKSDYTLSDAADNKQQMVWKLSAKDLESTYEAMPYGKFFAEADVVSTSLKAEAGAPPAAMFAPGSDLKINQLALGTEKFGLQVTGEIKGVKEDPIMPVGNLNIKFHSFDFIVGEMKAKGLLDDAQFEMLSSVVQQVGGKPMAEVKDFIFDIKREVAGTVMVGNSKLDNLIGYFLTGQMPPDGMPPAETGAIPQSTPAPEATTPAPAETPAVNPVPEPAAPAASDEKKQ